MALQALLLKRKIEEKQGRMAGLLEKRETFNTRERELEASMDEAQTEEQLRAVGENPGAADSVGGARPLADTLALEKKFERRALPL